jgi:hypothetical protein
VQAEARWARNEGAEETVLLDKELFADLPQGPTREGDVVARLETHEGKRRSSWFTWRSSRGPGIASIRDSSNRATETYLCAVYLTMV